MISSNYTNCKFCSRPDERAIAIVCRNNCLICSRCQLVSGIKRLLLEHSEYENGKDSGFCPICNAEYTIGMCQIVRSIRQGKGSATKPEVMDRPPLEIDLDEKTNEVVTFLRRFRSTYEVVEDKRDDSPSESGGLKRSLSSATLKKSKSTLDFYSASKLVVEKATQQQVMEFIVDCFSMHWATIIKNNHESVGNIFTKLFSKKKFVQKTNDFRAKSLLDYVQQAVPPEASAELYLIGKLLGVQPKPRPTITTAWSHITTTILVMNYCDMCMTNGQLIDQNGNPDFHEFKDKLTRSAQKVMRLGMDPSRDIPLTKALRIIATLFQLKHPYWSMAPLTACSVEYSTSVPWEKDSVGKLMHVLVLYCLQCNTIADHTVITLKTVGTMVQLATANSAATLPLDADIATTNQADGTFITGDGGEVVDTPAEGIRSGQASGTISGTVSPPSESPTPADSDPSQPTATRPFNSTSGVHGGTGGTNESSSQRAPRVQAKFIRAFKRRELMKLFSEKVISAIWRGRKVGEEKRVLREVLDKASSASHDTTSVNRQLLDLLGGENFGVGAVESTAHAARRGFVPFDLDQATSLAQGKALTIDIHDLCYLCCDCWQAEADILTQTHKQGSVTASRRKAISGKYDPVQAKMTAVERLALTRLVHWYNLDHEYNMSPAPAGAVNLEGNPAPPIILVDWDEVEESYYNRIFPFKVPHSFMTKSRNERNYLVDNLVSVMRKYDELMQKEDAAAAAGPFARVARGNVKKGMQGFVFGNGAVDSVMSFEDLEAYERALYLASQKLGGDGTPESSPGVAGTLRRDVSQLSDDELHAIERDQSQLHQLLQENAEVHQRHKDNKKLFQEHSSDHLSHDNPATHNKSSTSTSLANSVSNSRPTSASSRVQPLSTLAYQQQEGPKGHSLNMTDVLTKDPDVLYNVNMLSLSRPNSSTSKRDPATNPQSFDSGVDETSLEGNVNILNPQHANRTLSHQASDKRLKKMNEKYNSLVSDQKKNKLSSARSRVKQRIEQAVRDEMTMLLGEQQIQRERKEQEKREEALANGEDYDSMLDDETASLDVDTGEQEEMIRSFAEDIASHNMTSKHRVIEFLDMSLYTNKIGEITIDLATHLSTENPVKILSLKNSNLNEEHYQRLLNGYLKQWQLEKMIKLDMTDCKLALPGASYLSGKLANTCMLIHLNMSGVGMGDMGLKRLLMGVREGGGSEHMLRLDLRNNGITLATGALSLLAPFINLRVLDLSDNRFTLCTKMQSDCFNEALSQMKRLYSMSLANNKIQDDGFFILVNLINKDKLPGLRILDLASCFITHRSYDTLVFMLNNQITVSDNHIQQLYLQNNLLNFSQTEEIHSSYGKMKYATEGPPSMQWDAKFLFRCGNRNKGCTVSIMPENRHLGIGYPLGYELKDYGVVVYKG